MSVIASQSQNPRTDEIDAESADFSKAFPHLVPGVLCRRLTMPQIQRRAFSEMSNMAKAVLRYFDSHDQSLAEKMVDKFVERVFSRNLLSKFDPERGEIGRFLWGVMRNIALECFRERSRERNEARLYQSPRGSREPEPNVSAERNEQVERVRNWLMELPSAQRNAVARRFAALADLDSGGTIPNECVARHRGLKRLQRKAAESDIGDNTG